MRLAVSIFFIISSEVALGQEQKSKFFLLNIKYPLSIGSVKIDNLKILFVGKIIMFFVEIMHCIGCYLITKLCYLKLRVCFFYICAISVV